MNTKIVEILLFCVITIVFTALLAIFQQKVNLSFEKIVLPQLAPTLGFLILIFIFKSLKTSINVDVNSIVITKTTVAFFIPLIIFSIVFLVCRSAQIEVKLTDNLLQILPMMLTGILIGSIGEEIGWRGFLQPTLEKNHTILLSSILVGVLWGLWHIGHYRNGMVFMIGFLLFTISASLILRWLLQGTNYNLWVAAIFHFSVNLGFLVFFKNSLSNPKTMLINGIIWLMPAIIICLISAKEMTKI